MYYRYKGERILLDMNLMGVKYLGTINTVFTSTQVDFIRQFYFYLWICILKKKQKSRGRGPRAKASYIK